MALRFTAAQQEQNRISAECKSNPKRFWQYINKKTTSKTCVGDLKWTDENGKNLLAETDSDKAEALQDFFFICVHYRTDWRIWTPAKYD